MRNHTKIKGNLYGSYAIILLLGTAWGISDSAALEGPVRKCRTPVRSTTEKLHSEAVLNAASRQSQKTFPPINKPINIPVQFHIIYKMISGQARGNLSDETINAQIKVLNHAYQGSGFKFSLAGINRVENAEWFDKCLDYEGIEATYKNQLAVDPAHQLNAYTCGSNSGMLGFATFPDMYDESSPMHGIVLEYRSFPGGNPPYHEGDTAVHEIGHYLGLYHTFDEVYENCKDNDFVDDTAIENSSTYSCPTRKDTCPGKVGKDPVSNYMDYSFDTCMTSFSIGQINRMQSQVLAFKPSLLP